MLPSDYQKYIHLSRYSRWKESEGRRETWAETVNRLITFWEERFPQYTDYLRATVEPSILNLEVMPSMRTLMTAGEALRRDEVAGYNCSFAAIDNPKVFDEILYVLMCGTGVGFSVEEAYVKQLPEVPDELYKSDTVIKVPDSKIGWATAYRELISLLYAGKLPSWDLSKVRPAGARLKTFGGRASGPGPLDDLFKFTVDVFKKSKGRKLNTLEAHDIVCKIADIVVVGGVRRSALISLSDLGDERMRRAKSGAWWDTVPHRALANNSAVYNDLPDIGQFMQEWVSLYESKSGERGIFNRLASQRTAARNGRRDSSVDFGTNPCSEIILRPKQFCNLTEVVIRSKDTVDVLRKKIEVATFLGTLQSTLTNFRYLSKGWVHNTEEERLLGVSLTGIMDNPLTANPEPSMLEELRDHAINVNKRFSKELGIGMSAAITCVKPSGTVSQLVNSASGIHPRFSRFYIRTVRADKRDPLYTFMSDRGFKVEDELFHSDSTAVFSFPMKSPEEAIVVNDTSAISQLELWKKYANHWCEHKPSITVYVKENEWLSVGDWVYKNFDTLSGVSFLPYTDHVYKQAPYQPITEEEYEREKEEMPREVDWSKLSQFEKEDMTTSTKEFACTSGQCEL